MSETVQKPLIDLAALFEPVREDLDHVEQEFVRQVESRVQFIPQIGRYIPSSGGNRVRPAVLLLTSRLAGYSGEQAVLYGSVVEFIHTATLVHDDIIDDAELRRGRVAVHSKCGNDITVLMGDYLYIKSMVMAVTQDSMDVIRLLCKVTLRMIEGELHQLTKTGDIEITEDEYLEIIRRKTAYLFAGCAQIGGMLGGTSGDQRQALWEYGFNLGVAFQLVNDVLDYTADEAVPGKPAASDLREGKVTLPVVHLLESGVPRGRQLVTKIVGERKVTTEEWRQLRTLLAEHGSIDMAIRRAHQYATRARRVLSLFPASRERDALEGLTDYVLQRDRQPI